MARSLNPFRVLARHRNFRLFWGGQTVSLVGTWMQSVAQGWLALTLTDDPFMVGVVYASSSLPVMLFTLYGGVIADRVDRLRLITVAQAVLSVQAAVYWWCVWADRVTIEWVLALSLAGGIVNAFEIPSRQSLIVELVGREDLVDAVALNSAGFNVARVIGPSLAGVIIARLGLAWCFGLNALSYVAVLAGLLLVRLPRRPPRAAHASPWEGLRQGAGYIRRTPAVAVLVRTVAVYAIFAAPYLALLPVIARDQLGGDARTYAAMLSAVGVGAILAALALAAVSDRVRRGRLLAGGAVTFSVALIAFSLSRSPTLSIALLFVIGFTMILTNALSNGLLQTIVPDALRGRVMSAYVWVFVGVGPVLGPFAAGLVARATSAAVAVGLGAAVTLGYGLWTFARHREVTAL